MTLALIWKKTGIGSQKAIADFKRKIHPDSKNRKGVGHSGTLDPFAEGLLCVGLDEGCKLLSAFGDQEKVYEADFCLGVSSKELDWSGEKEYFDLDFSKFNDSFFSKFFKTKVAKSFQVPPQFSAVHVDGKRAYEWARQGRHKELKSREVEIKELQFQSASAEKIASHEIMSVKFRIRVSSGTYIRSFARDWGMELTGSPGILRKLVRVGIGPWHLNNTTDDRVLGLAEVEEVFDLVQIEDSDAERLHKYGSWNKSLAPNIPRHKHQLVVAKSQPNRPLALLNPDYSLKRVFLKNPLE